MRALDLFKGPHFDRENHCALRALVSQIQTELSGLGPNDGGTWNRADAHDHSALGAALCARIREKRWSQYCRPLGKSWRCAETYIKLKSRWTYLYRAVDKLGQQWTSC
jgi:hypothetical protein